jgi:hypothetical protein
LARGVVAANGERVFHSGLTTISRAFSSTPLLAPIHLNHGLPPTHQRPSTNQPDQVQPVKPASLDQEERPPQRSVPAAATRPPRLGSAGPAVRSAGPRPAKLGRRRRRTRRTLSGWVRRMTPGGRICRRVKVRVWGFFFFGTVPLCGLAVAVDNGLY